MERKIQRRRIRIWLFWTVVIGILMVGYTAFGYNVLFGVKRDAIRKTSTIKSSSRQGQIDKQRNKQTPNLLRNFTTVSKHPKNVLINSLATKPRAVSTNELGNWTIIVTVNSGYLDFFRNWYFLYRHLNIEYPVVIISEDDNAYKILQEFKSRKVTITNSRKRSAMKSAEYGSREFNKLVSERPTHILKYVERGTNVLYSDIDMVWFQNPFPYFTGDFDIWIQLDSVNNYCTGFMAIKSNTNTVKFLHDWHQALQERVQVNQKAFNRVLENSTIRFSVLDIQKFPPGSLFFSNNFTKVQQAFVVVVHNNWIVGHDEKLKRFRNMNLWFASDVSLPASFYVVTFLIFCIIVSAAVFEVKQVSSLNLHSPISRL